mgnify:CR=1 FL=1
MVISMDQCTLLLDHFITSWESKMLHRVFLTSHFFITSWESKIHFFHSRFSHVTLFYYFMGVKDTLLSWRFLDPSPLSSNCVLNSQIFQLSRFSWTTLSSLHQQPLFGIATLSILILNFQLVMFILKMVWLNL